MTMTVLTEEKLLLDLDGELTLVHNPLLTSDSAKEAGSPPLDTYSIHAWDLGDICMDAESALAVSLAIINDRGLTSLESAQVERERMTNDRLRR